MDSDDKMFDEPPSIRNRHARLFRRDILESKQWCCRDIPKEKLKNVGFTNDLIQRSILTMHIATARRQVLSMKTRNNWMPMYAEKILRSFWTRKKMNFLQRPKICWTKSYVFSKFEVTFKSLLNSKTIDQLLLLCVLRAFRILNIKISSHHRVENSLPSASPSCHFKPGDFILVYDLLKIPVCSSSAYFHIPFSESHNTCTWFLPFA